MTTKKLVPLVIILLGLALVIAAFVVWLEPPKEGGVFSVAGGIISFLAGLGASLKGWKDFLKKDEPANSIKQEMINRSETSTPIQAQTVNIYQAPPNPQSSIENRKSSNTLPARAFFVDHAQKLGKPIFGFIVDEDHPWPPKFIEYAQQAKLDAFLSKVKRQPVEFFTTRDNLAHNIATSVGRYLSEHHAHESPSPDGRGASGEDKKGFLPTWEQRNTSAVNYFLKKCTHIKNKKDESKILQIFSSWRLIYFTENGWTFSNEGALLFGPSERLPFNTDLIVESGTQNAEPIMGECLVSILQKLEKKLSPLWNESWEDPSQRDINNQPKKISKYPQTAIIEALVNFVIHRDYSSHEVARITIGENFVEFLNPGASPYSAEELLSSEKLTIKDYQRNILIINAIAKTRLGQRQRSGIKRIREALEDSTAKRYFHPPQFGKSLI
jgi:hypothetical protein